MQPAHPDGETKLPTSLKERTGERSGEQADDGPRRLRTQDGLHVPSSMPPALAAIEDGPARERALLALVSSARHELRAPLQSIQGFADLLASESYGALGSDQRVFVEHIIQGSWDLSRALDACFELIQAEALHLPSEPQRASVRSLLLEALGVAQHGGISNFETQLDALDADLSVEVDLRDFSKAMEALITALAPLARGGMLVSAAVFDGQIELMFRTNQEARTFRSLNELPRRGVSARALLWLRAASALFARSDGRLETSESYDQVRVLLPLMRDG